METLTFKRHHAVEVVVEIVVIVVLVTWSIDFLVMFDDATIWSLCLHPPVTSHGVQRVRTRDCALPE